MASDRIICASTASAELGASSQVLLDTSELTVSVGKRVCVSHMKSLCVLYTQPPRSLRPQWHYHLAYTALREGDRSQDCGVRERRWLGDGDAPGVLRCGHLHDQRDPLAVAARSEVYRRMEHARHEGIQHPAVAAARLDCRRPG